ncbi:thioredoxin domain-containing protein [Planomonospora sp. ID82291]|uniref:DsbA family protein n=1 Tax=Planomonospora sp. ID82291 TaxID=2738136 RepID=UPI0018C3D331|nr:thioredoxin domain-containing protein [Planomonospora sp. ID82291]MBG0813381.1 thioredoxin domain-containing protein [Planomonospora sp. ID82291]
MSTQARTRTRELRNARAAAEERRKKRNRLITAGGGMVIVLLLAAIVISLVNAAGNAEPQNDAAARGGTAAQGAAAAPANATAGGALSVGNAAAPVKLEVYLDYMCPFCGRFEQANSAELERLVADGTVRLELYPLSFLDRMSSGTEYSTRAANAVATVADQAPGKLLAFNAALFADQPAEGGQGLSDDEIAGLAREAGVPQEVVDTFTRRTFESWVASSTTAVFATGISGTPTVKINGVTFEGDLYTAGPLTAAVTAVKGS